MHDSSRFRPAAGAGGKRGRLSQVDRVVIADRPWTIRFFPRPGFERSSARWLLAPVVAVGLLVSVTFFALTRSQVTALIAEHEATERLRRSEAELRHAKDAASGLPISGAPGMGSFDVALPTAGPNLVVRRATVNRRSFYLGDVRRCRVVFVLKNTGTQPVNGTVDVAINATLRPGTAGGTTLIVGPFAPVRVSLRPGASRRYSVPIGAFAADAPAGTYDLSLRVDASDTVTETSEKDNFFSVPVTVTVKARPARPARGHRT